ncbi:unnamed protein product, partial [Musa acuminata subsp. burmannicoides]
ADGTDRSHPLRRPSVDRACFPANREMMEFGAQQHRAWRMDSSRTAGYEDSSGCETTVVHPTFDTENN